MNSRTVRGAAALAALFAAAAWMTNARVAAIVVLVIVAAYLNHFYVVHSLIKAFRRRPVSRTDWARGILGVMISVVVVLQGGWLALVLVGAAYALADAIVSRLR